MYCNSLDQQSRVFGVHLGVEMYPNTSPESKSFDFEYLLIQSPDPIPWQRSQWVLTGAATIGYLRIRQLHSF